MNFYKKALHFIVAINLWAFVLSTLLPSACADVIAFSDGMDDPTLYSSTTINFDVNDLSTLALGLAPVDGNPGAHFVIFHDHAIADPMAGTTVQFQSAFFHNQFVYNPIAGAITDISFSVDISYFDLNVDDVAFDQFFFAIQKPDFTTSYAAFTDIPDNILIAASDWQTVTVTGLTSADFPEIDFSGVEELTFGFGFTSSGDVTNGPASIYISADNFSVSINAVPEPSAGMLVGAMLLLAAHRPRVRQSPFAPRT